MTRRQPLCTVRGMERQSAESLWQVTQPRHLQLVRAMRTAIGSGTLQIGDRLPSERDACRRFSVSRTTVRRALAELHAQGYVEPDGTRGWFVTAFVEPSVLSGFSDQASQRGLMPGSNVLRALVRAATLDEAESLEVAPGSEVFELERVRLLGGIPVGWQRAVVLCSLAPGIGEHDFGAVSLYQLLRDHRVVPSRADYDIEAGVTDTTRSKLLEVRESSPVLLIRATTFDREGRCIELSEGAFLGERYRFTASVSGPADDAKGVR